MLLVYQLYTISNYLLAEWKITLGKKSISFYTHRQTVLKKNLKDKIRGKNQQCVVL